MRKITLVCFWVVLLTIGIGLPAQAQTCASYPYTLSNGTTADADQVMANFGSIESCANTALAPLNSPSFTGSLLLTGPSVPALIESTNNEYVLALDYGGSSWAYLGTYNNALYLVGSTATHPTIIDASGNMTVTGAGTTCVIGSGTGPTSCTSDARLKTNIRPILGGEALEGLSKIDGVTFNWADPHRPQKEQIGVLAQDVLKAFPQLVGTAATMFEGKRGDYYTVDYAALVSPLISGVNALNRRTKGMPALSQEIHALRVKVDTQAKEITQMRAEIAKLARTLDRRTAAVDPHVIRTSSR